MSDQAQTDAVLHQLELVRHDLARVETRLGELVSNERYTIEHEQLRKDIARIEARVTEEERKRETQKHVIMSSFLFPVLIAFITYVLLNRS